MSNLTPIIITGIGTGVGKTLVSAIIAEALQADYWKPVQAGYEDGTDSEWIKNIISNSKSKIHPETYKLKLAASPHIAAREEGLRIDLDFIKNEFDAIRNKKSEIGNEKVAAGQRSSTNDFLIIEGAGGLMVPLNEKEFAVDLFKKLNAKIILVSRNYLGSINHSLLTAQVCKHYDLPVAGWIFNDQYLDYENEIVQWSLYPKIASIPFCKDSGKEFVLQQAEIIKPALVKLFSSNS
jgi:dethiobiotin synthetase